MAPKIKSETSFASKSLTIPETTNYVGVPPENDAGPQYQCFVHFLTTSYLHGALFKSPTLYKDILETFWRTAICETMALEDKTTKIMVSCQIGDKHLSFDANNINIALDLPTDKFDEDPTDQEISDFLDFINYNDTINLGTLNRKHVRREWSFLFDALQKVFSCRKSGWDHLSHVTMKLAISLAYNKKLNVGSIIIKELAGRLGKSIRGRGTDIFYARFIQCILNSLDDKLHEESCIVTSNLAYPKSMSKVIFASLDSKNNVDVKLNITPYMSNLFKTYPLAKPKLQRLSWNEEAKTVGEQTQSNPSPSSPSKDQSANTSLDVRKPTTSSSQKGDVSKKKKKRNLSVLEENIEIECEEPVSPLTRPKKKKSKTKATSVSSQKDSDLIKEGVDLLLSIASQKVTENENVNVESTQNQEPTLDSGEQQGGPTLSGEHIQIEIPSISQGELPKSISEHTTLSESNISLNRDSHLGDDSTFDQSQSTSVIEPLSSDLLTTQDLKSVGQELHAGAYSNDTNKNMEASPVLTGDSVPYSPISQVELEMPSQANRDGAVTHPISMETASASTAIQMLDSENQPSFPVVSQPQNTSDIINSVIGCISSQRSDSMEVDHPTNVETSIPIIGIPCLSHQTGPSTTPSALVEDSSEKSVDETNSSSNLTAIHQWLQPVQIVNGSISQSVPTQCQMKPWMNYV